MTTAITLTLADYPRLFPLASGAVEANFDVSEALLGADAHGLEVNRSKVAAFYEQAYRSGITARLVSVDKYFAEYLGS